MFAVVVFVHFIQYPMLKNVPENARADYNKKYCDRAGFVIAPAMVLEAFSAVVLACLLYTSPSPRDATLSRMPSSA